jgi:hypothetical protein
MHAPGAPGGDAAVCRELEDVQGLVARRLDCRPGPVYRRLLAAWSERVGLDIAAQARSQAASGDRGA